MGELREIFGIPRTNVESGSSRGKTQNRNRQARKRLQQNVLQISFRKPLNLGTSDGRKERTILQPALLTDETGIAFGSAYFRYCVLGALTIPRPRPKSRSLCEPGPSRPVSRLTCGLRPRASSRLAVGVTGVASRRDSRPPPRNPTTRSSEQRSRCLPKPELGRQCSRYLRKFGRSVGLSADSGRSAAKAHWGTSTEQEASRAPYLVLADAVRRSTSSASTRRRVTRSAPPP
jgi:hypothetical protein